MKNHSNTWIASAIMILSGFSQALAATITWDGGLSPYSGTSWNDPVNWAGNVKPGSVDAVVFSANGNTGLSSGKVLSLDAPQTIYRLDIPSWAQNPAFTIGNAADVAAGNTLTLTRAYLGPNFNNDITIVANVVLADDSIWETTEDAFIVNGSISGVDKDFAKWGANSVSLRGANSYTGETLVNAGTLRLDFGGPTSPAADIVIASSPLMMNGGTLAVKAKSSVSRSQTFNTATANRGASSMAVESASGANVFLSLAAIARTNGATLNLKQPTGNTAINANNGYTTLNTNDASGILGAYLTVMPQNGTAPADWAANDGVNIVAYTGYTTLAGDLPNIGEGATSNVQINNTSTGDVGLGAAMVTVNTLKVADAAARVLNIGGNTLRLGTIGGILTPSGTGPFVISNGTLTAGSTADTAGELVFVNATVIANMAVTADNGAGKVTLTKSGSGTMVLTSGQTHTGGTFVNAGTLQLPAMADPLATNGDIVVNGGTLNLGGNTQNLSGELIMRGGTLTNGTIMKSVSNYDVQGGTISAALKGSVGLVKTSANSVTINGANTYSGDTYVLEGAVTFDKTSAIVNGNLFVGSQGGMAPASVSCVNTPLNSSKNWTVYKNGSLYSGTSAQYLSSKLSLIGGSFSGSQPYFQTGSSVEMTGGNLGGTIYGNGSFEIKSLSNETPAVVSASLRSNSHTFNVSRGSGPIDLRFTGGMVGTCKLTKIGTGLMVMSGSSHENGTDVNAGVLLVNNTSGSGTGKGAVTINAGSTFGGTGFIGGVATYGNANVTVTGASGNSAVVAPGSIDLTTGDHVIGALTVGNLAVQTNNVTFGAYSTLKINIATNGTCDKLVVNGTLSLATATDTLEMNVADAAALKQGTYTLVTFQQRAAGADQAFTTVVGKPTRGRLEYTATSLNYVIDPTGTLITIL
jgi:autotransporter-associated beta strand protein